MNFKWATPRHEEEKYSKEQLTTTKRMDKNHHHHHHFRRKWRHERFHPVRHLQHLFAASFVDFSSPFFPPYLTLLFRLSFSVCPFLFSLSVVDCFSSVLSILFCFPPLCLISFRRRQSASPAVARKPAGKMTKFVPNARNFYRWAPKEREREEGAGAFN